MASVKSSVAFINDEWGERREPPRIYSKQSRLANTSLREVEIFDARPRQVAGELDLDKNGFVLVDYPANIDDFDDKSAVREHYFPHMRELMLKLTGAQDALAIGFYQVRSADPEHFFDAYSLYMHCDFSPDTAAGFARSVLREQDKNYPDSDWDFAWYNLWRPIGGPVERDPLVLIDASTVKRSDIIDYLAVKDDTKGRAALPLYSDDYRFYYVPQMRPDELLVFKQLDTRPDRALVCPHTSFVDPTAPAGAKPRRSIDIRFMCVFPKSTV